MADETRPDPGQIARYFDAPAAGASPPHFPGVGTPIDEKTDPSTAGPSQPGSFPLRDFGVETVPGDADALAKVRDVELDVQIELGRAEMVLEDVLKLQPGSIVLLDKLVGDLVDVVVNGRLVARGEVVVLDDNFCVRVVELIPAADAA